MKASSVSMKMFVLIMSMCLVIGLSFCQQWTLYVCQLQTCHMYNLHVYFCCNFLTLFTSILDVLYVSADVQRVDICDLEHFTVLCRRHIKTCHGDFFEYQILVV